jgi:hypothetical protein
LVGGGKSPVRDERIEPTLLSSLRDFTDDDGGPRDESLGYLLSPGGLAVG